MQQLSIQVTPWKPDINCRLQSTKLMSLLISKNISKRKTEFRAVLWTSNCNVPWLGCYALLTALSAVLNSIVWHDILADIPLFNQELNVPFKFLFRWGWIRRRISISMEKKCSLQSNSWPKTTAIVAQWQNFTQKSSRYSHFTNWKDRGKVKDMSYFKFPAISSKMNTCSINSQVQ